MSSISWNKDNRAMILSQLINYNMENIFLEKSCTNVMEKLFPDSLSKKSKLDKFYTICFCCMPSWELSKHIETKLQIACFYFSYKAIWKSKKRFGTNLLSSFSTWFQWKIYLLLYYINWPSFIVWLPFLCEILDNICIVIVNKVVTS